MGLIGLKSRVSRTDSLSIRSTGGSVSLAFPPSSGHPHSLARGPLPTSKQQLCTESFSYLITLTRTLQPPLSTFKDNCDCVETMRIMQANLPILKSAISNLIPSVYPLWWCSVAQLCPILCGPTDYSPPGSSAHGIFQARILEGVPFPVPVIFPTQGLNLSLLCLLHWQADFLLLAPPGKPICHVTKHIHRSWELRIRHLCLGDYSTYHQIRSVAQSCPTLCDPMNCSTPGLPVHHQLPEFTQTQVHRVSDAIQPSHPLSSPSPP